MAVEAGTRVGRFVIHEYLGQGDLGLLFRARGPNSGTVAVKVLRSLSGARVRARFLVLARRLGGIRHPNLASVLDFGEHDDAPYLVLQHVAGGSLADLQRSSQISQPAAIWVLRGIAAGIDHAHRSGIVHGALKPRQVVLDVDDHPMVTDFGLTPLRWPRPDGVSVVVSERNAAYTAPELVTGGQPTAAADRYAFATMAYELLTGRTPFTGEPHDVMNAQLDAQPPPPSSVNPALNQAYDRVLLRGLSRDPRARWQSCAELVEALADAVSPAGPTLTVVKEADPGPPPVAQHSPRRGAAAGDSPQRVARWSLALAGALLVIALAVGGMVTWLLGQPSVVAIVLSGATVRAGDTFVVTATNVPAYQAGMIELHSDPEQIGTFKADGNGYMRVEVVVPEDAVPGDHVVTLCWEDGCHGSARLTVEDAAPSASPDAGPPEAVPVAAPPTPVQAGPGAGTLSALRSTPSDGGSPAPGATAPPTDQPQPTPTRSTPPAPSPMPRPSHSPSPRPSASPKPSPKSKPSPRPRPSPRSGPPEPEPSPTSSPSPTVAPSPTQSPPPAAAGPLLP
jgi:hypothetical protein